MTNPLQAGGVDRREFVARLLLAVPAALVVTGLGSPAYDVFAAGDRDGNFYLWGAMGGAASLGLGLALAQPARPVVVITGDGEQLMGIGSLATIGAKQPPNLSIVVLDNGHFGETGMQRSHASLGTDLAAVAQAVGIAHTLRIDKLEQAAEVAACIDARKGPALAHVLISASQPPRALPPRDGSFVKNRFRAHLGFAPF
jgi:thiamine pyrophosphate-dependent acetolactate synthase large subunit-like protein